MNIHPFYKIKTSFPKLDTKTYPPRENGKVLVFVYVDLMPRSNTFSFLWTTIYVITQQTSFTGVISRNIQYKNKDFILMSICVGATGCIHVKWSFNTCQLSNGNLMIENQYSDTSYIYSFSSLSIINEKRRDPPNKNIISWNNLFLLLNFDKTQYILLHLFIFVIQ